MRKAKDIAQRVRDGLFERGHTDVEPALCSGLPRVALCSALPTPLEEMGRLSEALGGPGLWVKRDDLTGLALGGNKIRNHEFIFGEVRERGCDAVITTAGVQSNMCRATAAAASRLGLRCVLLLRGTGQEARQGNLLLDELLGADVRFIPTSDPYDDRVPGWLADAERELAGAGYRPYVLHLTGATSTLATCAYVDASEELARQFDAEGMDPEWVFVTTGSGITAAGLALGLKHLGRRTRVVGVSSNSGAGFLAGRVVQYANEAAGRLGLSTRVVSEDFQVLDEYVGPGYGVCTAQSIEAIRMVARLEGILLDPVYTGKCMAGLIDCARAGRIGRGETAVFLHSGGAPNLFALADALGRPRSTRVDG